MRSLFKVSVMLFATAALSGCASIFGHAFADRTAPEAAPVQPAGGNVELAAARQAMDAGMTAEAIDHFRAAQMDPDALPAASNGLGVAYARLGRLDLADRYFRIAVALDPANERFAANMLRLQDAYALARASDTQTTQVTQATVAPAPEKLAVANEPGTIERISRGEVHVRSFAATAAAPIAVVASRDAVPAPAVDKVEGKAETVAAPASYPVRIDLSSPTRAARGRPIAAAYPQRIDLAKVAVAD